MTVFSADNSPAAGVTMKPGAKRIQERPPAKERSLGAKMANHLSTLTTLTAHSYSPRPLKLEF